MRKKYVIIELKNLDPSKHKEITFPEMADPKKWFKEGYQAALDDMKELIQNTHFPII